MPGLPFTPEELAAIRDYQLPRQAWFALANPVELLASTAWLAWVVRPLYRAAERHAGLLVRALGTAMNRPPVRALCGALDLAWRGPGWGTALLFAFYDMLLFRALFLPVELYLGYFHEHAHGLSNYTPAGYAWDLVKETALGALFTSLLVLGLYGLARRTPRWWALLGAPSALLLLGASALDPYRAQLYFEHAPLPPGEARDAIQSTLARAGVEHADVVVEHTARATKKLQAYFAGQGPTRTVVVNDALLTNLSPQELSAAVAHEAGHLRERHWPSRVAAALAVVGFLWLASRVMAWLGRRGAWGMDSSADVRSLPALTALLLLVGSLGEPATAWFSRRGELAADRYAVELTRAPDAFASMLVKAARVNKMDPDPPHWLVLLGMSHPSIAERLANVESMKPAAAGR